MKGPIAARVGRRRPFQHCAEQIELQKESVLMTDDVESDGFKKFKVLDPG